MQNMILQPVLDFHAYPSAGKEDWRYAFATARVRALLAQMPSKNVLLDLAGTDDFEQAVDLLAATDYVLTGADKSLEHLEEILLARRTAVRELFAKLIIDKPIVELFKSRDDFANLRLALRRKLLDKPIGVDYSNDGNVEAEQFEQIFEQENYSPLPDFMQQAIECAVLDYYKDKNVRRIDYALDRCQGRFNLKRAAELNNTFLLELFRMQTDLTNIRTMMRLKLTESDVRDVFLEGGYVELQSLNHALDVGYEAVAGLFFATPYYEVVEAAISYFLSEHSFLKLQQRCSRHLEGFLMSTFQITAGPQPVIAYLLLKEEEIRNVRLILTAKKNFLDTKLILDCLGE